MKLTVEGLIEAIMSARRLETLQCELLDAQIEQLIEQSSTPPDRHSLSGRVVTVDGFPGS